VAVKQKLLGLPDGPVVTAAAAEAMAAAVRAAVGVDVGLATTGAAGPDEQEGQPVGTLFIGLALGDRVMSEHARLPGDRNRVRQYSVISALNFLRRTLLASSHA
jgi:nicotinamide-nucleotide amidase